MTTFLVLARTYAEGMRAAKMFSLRPAIYPLHADELRGWEWPTQGIHLLRIDGWERSREQSTEVARLATLIAEREHTLPSAEQAMYGQERAELAAGRLARIREAKRHGSPFLEVAAPTAPPERDAWRWLLHLLHLCPTRRAGLPCTADPGTCRWP